MNIKNKLFIFLLILTPVSVLNARDQIKGAGSSTVYPFITVVAEQFSKKNPAFKTPVIESTGTGAGLNLFCQGLGEDTPDFADASRPIKESELALCKKNGVNNIIELKIGYDAIVIIHPTTPKKLKLTKKQIFLALAAMVPDANGNLITNPYKKWSDIDKSLPNLAIKVMGPPSTSGTRDSFMELAMNPGCKALQKDVKFNLSKDKINQACISIRTDGAWINAGENDYLLVNKVARSKDTFAVIGYSFFEQNQNKIDASFIDGVYPSAKNLAMKQYPLFRPLFVYIKADHIGFILGLNEFMNEITDINTTGKNGYLVENGLIPLEKNDTIIKKMQ